MWRLAFPPEDVTAARLPRRALEPAELPWATSEARALDGLGFLNGRAMRFQRCHPRRPVLAQSRHWTDLRRMSAYGGGFNGSWQHRVHSIGRAFKAQGLSRTLIEAQGNLIEIRLGELR